MIFKENGNLQWLEFELLADCKNIDHRVFLRHGGVSSGTYGSLNFLGGKGDHPSNVEANFSLIKTLINNNTIITAHQVHGSEVLKVTKPDKFIGDGLTTNIPNLPLLIKHADCQSACFYDPIHQAISMVHCGWRGNVLNMYAETIKAMHSHYGSSPENLLVCISPSLGPERSEFIHYKNEFPESFWQFQYKPNYFDLWALAEWQLKNAGILSNHIQIARESTWASPEKFFSYRRCKETGSHGSIAFLKSE